MGSENVHHQLSMSKLRS